MSDNYHYVPCGTCRGSKFMMKLGGIYGECNTCKGIGEIKKENELTFDKLTKAVESFGAEPIVHETTKIKEEKKKGKK